jgi:hypothetical protein
MFIHLSPVLFADDGYMDAGVIVALCRSAYYTCLGIFAVHAWIVAQLDKTVNAIVGGILST